MYVVAAVFVGIVVVDSLDLFGNKTWSEINHASHSHFVPFDEDKGIILDEGVSISNCPQRPPTENEFLSTQCQLLTMVTVGEKTYYIPNNRNPNVPDDQFPFRPPGSGVIITANGQLASADAH